MDYCEILLGSVHKVVTTEMALQKYNSDSFVSAKIIEVRQNKTYLVQDDGGRRFEAESDLENLTLNNSVYIIGTTIIGKKLNQSEIPKKNISFYGKW